MRSKWCNVKNAHGWCTNRDHIESNCSCPCHTLKHEIRVLERDIEALERQIEIKGKTLHKLTGFFR